MVSVTDRLGLGVRVKSQEAPVPKPTAVQLSPPSAEWIAEVRVLGTISLWFPKPDHCMGLSNPLVQLQSCFGSDMVMFHIPCGVFLYRFSNPCVCCCEILELGPHGERAFVTVRVQSRDVTRAELITSIVNSMEG